jgi:hypothetical protein
MGKTHLLGAYALPPRSLNYPGRVFFGKTEGILQQTAGTSEVAELG